ncbi:MAG TPA: tetratricopeptide repeat protein [Candidatus Krumholzibacteriaceae bacterium]|nr:tetratricopeptide repeat protein [Candidatus Krumholzibacteriaceae bacterium]
MGSDEKQPNYVDEGIGLFRQRRFKEAAEKLEKAIDLEPENVSLWNLHAQALANTGDYEEALKSIEVAVALDDTNFLNWQLKGTFLMRQDDLEGSKKAIDKSLELNKSSVTYTLRGQVDYNLQNYDEALGFFEEALNLDPDNPLANQMKGLVLFIQGKHGEAIPFIEKALTVGTSESLEKILEECRKRAEPG